MLLTEINNGMREWLGNTGTPANKIYLRSEDFAQMRLEMRHMLTFQAAEPSTIPNAIMGLPVVISDLLAPGWMMIDQKLFRTRPPTIDERCEEARAKLAKFIDERVKYHKQQMRLQWAST